MTDHETGRWVGVGAVGVGAAAVGTVLEVASLLLAGAVVVTVAGYVRASGPPELGPDGDPPVTVDRRLDEEKPDPGETVEVTVTVRNDGDQFLPDVRIVDGVPAGLSVVEGTPKHAAPLRPGAATTFTYAVETVRGEHEWRPATVVLADAAGSVERETTAHAETVLRPRLHLRRSADLPLHALTGHYAGRLTTQTGGSGLEFHATRDYRSGDPFHRIDWHRRAKTGEFATVEYREERSATVVLLVDGRHAAYRAPRSGATHAVEHAVSAAALVAGGLFAENDRVGLATLGREDCWVQPTTGRVHRERIRTTLAAADALSPVPPAEPRYATFADGRAEELRERDLRRLVRRLPSDAQVVFFTPLCDRRPLAVARRLVASGHPTSVVSPDPTATEGSARELAAMRRTDRIGALRSAGVRVVDWDTDDRLAAALATASARWSR